MKTIEFTYQKNARDLGGLIGFGGKKVKYGHLFRSGLLAKVSQEDIDKIKQLGITDIVDFRGQKEFEYRPDYHFEGVRFHNFPTMAMKEDENHKENEDSNLLYFMNGSTEGKKHMMQLYRDSVSSDNGKEAYKNFFRLLQSNNGAILFHCSQGKDRAGLGAYFLEIALGVDEKTARDDYLRSNVAMELKIEQLKEMVKDKPYYTKEYEKALEDVFSARSEYLDEAIRTILENHKSVEEYLKKDLEVDLDLIRKKYLE